MATVLSDQLQLLGKLIAVPEEGRQSGVEGVDVQIAVVTAQMAAGDEEAFRWFHEAYFDRLYRYLLVVTGGDEQLALDGLQETLLRVAKHVRSFEQEGIFWSWLTVLARSAARDGARRRQSYLKMLAGYARALFGSQPREPVDSIDAEAELRACLDAALASLEALDQSLVEGKYFGGKTVRELAQETGLTVKSVESRLLRARRTIKQQVLVLLEDERSDERE